MKNRKQNNDKNRILKIHILSIKKKINWNRIYSIDIIRYPVGDGDAKR